MKQNAVPFSTLYKCDHNATRETMCLILWCLVKLGHSDVYTLSDYRQSSAYDCNGAFLLQSQVVITVK